MPTRRGPSRATPTVRDGALHYLEDGAPADAPLLTTKLTPPAGHGQWAPRPRLLQPLAAAARYPLTVVAAPAGFGKTTLLSAWAAGHDGPVAWVTLDVADRDPQRFWSYLAA